MSAESTEWVENRARDRAIPQLGLTEFWTSRELAFFFAVRDVKVRYKQAVLGVAWVVLQPLVGAAAFTFMFNGLADVETDGSYFSFALSGFVVWTFVSHTINAGGSSLLAHNDLITHVRFPLIAAPTAAVLFALVDFMVGTVIAGGWSLASGDGFSAIGLLVGFPASIALMVVFAMGPGLIFAPALVKYRDSGALLGLCVQLGFFLGPVAYPADLVDEPWRSLQYLNPVTGVLDLYRWGLIDAPAPAVGDIALSTAVACAITLFGLVTFRRNEQLLVDVI